MTKYKAIGILGGMGPQATAELYFQIIKIFQKEYGAKYDDDFPEMVIINLPLPDVVETNSVRDTVRTCLINGAIKLEKSGADFIIIPCNTVETYLENLRSSVKIPVLSIIEEVAKCSKEEKLGLIATEKTIKQGIYSRKFRNLVIPAVKDQKRVTKIIMNILSGKFLSNDKKILFSLVNKMKRQGAKKVILGCTDLPLLFTCKNTIDTIEVLAKAAVREAQNLINKRTTMKNN